MSEDLNLDLEPIAAAIGFNDGANNGFWRVQPREKFGKDAGQWIEMGAELRMFYKGQRGETASVTGRAVGSTGTPDGVRVLIQGQGENGVPDGIYGANTANVRIAEAILPEKLLEQQGIKNTPKISREQEALLPTLDSLERADITDEDIRLINDGIDSPEAKEQAAYKKSVEADEAKAKSEPAPEAAVEPKDLTRDPVAEVLADVAFEGDTTATVDDLLKAQESLALPRDPGTTQKAPLDLERGDIILGDDGEEATVLDVRLGNDTENIPARVRVQKADGSTQELTPAMRDRLAVVSGRRGTVRRPAEPTPSPAPETSTPEDATPNTPDPETTDPGEINIADGVDVVMTDQGLAPANFPPSDRLDDGSDFDLPTLTNEQLDEARRSSVTPLLDPDGTPAKYVNENGQVVDAEDPFGMMAVLAKIFPNAKFTPEGALVLHRQKDKDGRIFELRANNSGKRAIVYSMRWTNPNDPTDYKEYQHKDDRHSVAALFRKDNGPQDLLDRLLGRVDNNGKDWGSPQNFKFGNTRYNREDSLFKRLKWFMSGGNTDRKKMEEIGDNAVRLAQGRAAVFHKDGTVKNSEIPSLWEAFTEYVNSGPTAAERDLELTDNLYQTMYAVFGRIPMDERSHARAREAIRADFARQFPNRTTKETRAFNGLVTAASERMRGIYRTPTPQVRSLRYASKDRTRVIERGMTVEYTNNVGETSTVKVRDLVENTNATVQNPNGTTSYDYGDAVIITDVNGNNIKVNALKLRILANQQSPLTVYKKNLSGNALTQRRIDQGVFTPPQSGQPEPTRPRPTRTPNPPIPGEDTVITDPAPAPKLIDDFITGEMLYSKGEGRPLGIIKATKPVTSRNGSQGIAFLYTKPDGTEGQVVYALGTEINPKKA